MHDPDIFHFRKPQILEADGLYTAVVEYPKGTSEKFAFVLEHKGEAIKMYFFMGREAVKDIICCLVDQIGTEA